LLILRIFFTERVCLNPKHKVADRLYQIPNQVALELTPAAAKSPNPGVWATRQARRVWSHPTTRCVHAPVTVLCHPPRPPHSHRLVEGADAANSEQREGADRMLARTHPTVYTRAPCGVARPARGLPGWLRRHGCTLARGGQTITRQTPHTPYASTARAALDGAPSTASYLKGNPVD
jgi:hypothetical protein